MLADVDLESAADVATLSRMINAGQSCIAAKRIIVEDSIYDVFVEKLQSRVAKFNMGDPLLSDTDVGPIAREDLRQNLHRQVTETIAAGATCLLGGELSDAPGTFNGEYLSPWALVIRLFHKLNIFPSSQVSCRFQNNNDC